MGRPLRQAAGGVVYHVLNRRVLRLDLFEDEGDYLAFVGVLVEALDRPGAPELFALCLMPNHWHLLLRPRRDGDLPRWMQWLTVTHTHRWHRHRHNAGTGPVYQGRFKSFPVQSDGHFLAVARYVERNGLRARLCARAERWRWSSLGMPGREGASPIEGALCGRLTAWPVARPRDWVGRVNRAESAAELEALRLSVRRGRPLGTARWVGQTVARLGLQNTVRPRGRPRKEAVKSS